LTDSPDTGKSKNSHYHSELIFLTNARPSRAVRRDSMYEQGMEVSWDDAAKRITIIFRGEVVVLPKQFPDRKTGINAAEAYCRRHGWRPEH
jgi:hypothetical protein